MGTTDDIWTLDSAAFVDPDLGFGESVTYTKAVTGATRTINAVVERMSPTPGPSQSGSLLPKMRVHVRNSVTTGITPGEWKNGDTITVAERRGGTARTHQLHWPSDDAQHDAGMVVFELR